MWWWNGSTLWLAATCPPCACIAVICDLILDVVRNPQDTCTRLPTQPTSKHKSRENKFPSMSLDEVPYSAKHCPCLNWWQHVYLGAHFFGNHDQATQCCDIFLTRHCENLLRGDNSLMSWYHSLAPAVLLIWR